MFRWFFRSLSRKFFFAIMVGFLGTSLLFLGVFTRHYMTQFQREREATSRSVEQLTKLSIENAFLVREMRALVHRAAIEKVGDTRTMLTLNPQEVPLLKAVNPSIWPLLKRKKMHVPSVLTMGTDITTARYSALERALQLLGIAFVTVVSVMTGLLWLLRRYVLDPVSDLVTASERLASGDLKARVPLRQEGMPDELGRFSETFNQMAESLQKSVKEIADKEAFQQALIDSIPDSIRVIDRDYKVLAVNSAYCKKLGQRMSDVLGSFCYGSSHKRDTPCPESLVTCPVRRLSNVDSDLQAVQRFIKRDGKEIFVEVSAALMKNQKGEDLYVESIRDLTRDIQFSHQQKLSSLGMLASSVAHEMRNPLGSVRLIVEGLLAKSEKGTLKEEELNRYLNLMDDQMGGCIDVTERILKLSRMSSGEIEKINLCAAVSETLSLLDYEAKKVGIRVIENMPDTPLMVRANESELRMVVVNLVQNAFHALGKEGKVTLSVSENKEGALLSVADTGVGMTPEEVDRIFEPFYSVGRKDREGTGLGLTITKDIIESFDGRITVTSEKGKGTQFQIFLKKTG